MKKIVFSFFVLLFLLTSAHQLSAATPRPIENFTDETFVYNLSVSGKTYSPGDEVQGTFTILNASENYLDKVQYLIYVAGDIDTNFRHNIFGKVYSPYFTLGGKDPKKISFNYKLPTVLPFGEKELVVRSLYNGVPFGKAHIPLEIAQGVLPLEVSYARIIVLNEPFPIANGPTLMANRPGIFSVRFLPIKNKELVLTPEVKIYKESADVGELLSEKILPTYTLNASSTEFTYNLPTNYPAGIYEATITMRDENDNNRRTFTAHYIIGGNIATVRSVSFPEETAEKGGIVNVSSEITGNPDDIVTGEFAQPLNVTVKTVVKNPNGKILGEVTEEKDIKDVEKIITPVQIKKSASVFEVTVEVYDASGVLLSSLSRASGVFTYSPLVTIGQIILLMLSVLLIIRLVFGKKSFIFSFVLLVALLSFLGGAGGVEASSDISISTPVPGQVITAGAPFELEGEVVVSQCRNGAALYTLSHSGIREEGSEFDMATDPFQIHVYEMHMWPDDDGTEVEFLDVPYSFRISFVAPSTPGNYFICVGVRDWRTDGANILIAEPAVACRDFVVVDNPCGSAIEAISPSAPTTGLCEASYTDSGVTSNDTTGVHSWSCLNGGISDTQCYVDYCQWGTTWNGTSCVTSTESPVCGTAATDQVPIELPPTSNLCEVGISSHVSSTADSNSFYYNMDPPDGFPDSIVGTDGIIRNRSLHGWHCLSGGQQVRCNIPRCPEETPTWTGNACVAENRTVQCGSASRRVTPYVGAPNYSERCDGNGYTVGLPVGTLSPETGFPVWEWQCIPNRYGSSDSINPIDQEPLTCYANRQDISNPICQETADSQGVFDVSLYHYDPASGQCFLNPDCGNTYFQDFTQNPCYRGTVSNQRITGGTYSWDCTNGVVTISCQRDPVISGQCSYMPVVVNTCDAGTPVLNYPPNDNYNKIVWSCFGINGGGDQTGCSVTCPLGHKVENGACVPEGFVGQCDNSGAYNCTSGTPSPAMDFGGYHRWACLGSNPSSSDDDDLDCEFPIVSPPIQECDLQISSTQNTKVTNSPTGKCSLSWSAQSVYTGSGLNPCTDTNISCTFDGSPAGGITFTNQQIDLGAHSVVCTDSVTGQTTTLNPRPQCRLNPSYGEF